MSTKQTPVEFFYANAAYSYNPATQTEEEGRRQCAELLADAERRGSDAGLAFEWSIDRDSDSSDWSDDPDPWQVWQCLCRDESGDVVAALAGIDFGRDGDPWGDNYRRVVEAELAAEALPDTRDLGYLDATSDGSAC